MTAVPDPEELRAGLRALGGIDAKVVGALVTLMIAHHQRIRDDEWLAENFTRVAVAAHGFDEHTAPSDDVDTIARYAEARMPELLRLAFGLFLRTAADLQTRGGTFGFADACRISTSYFGEPPPR